MTAKKAAAPKAATPEKPKRGAPGTNTERTIHLLVRPDETGHIAKVEPFSAELVARRALDDRDGWRYVGIKPGQVFSLGEGIVQVTE